MSYYQKNSRFTRQQYHNEKGIGIWYPEHRQRISGISRVFGLAYIDEGWSETDKGVGRVELSLGDKVMPCRCYVKNRYWVRTLDTTMYADGEYTVSVRAWDKTGAFIGEASQLLLIDNAEKPVRTKYFCAPNGSADGDGSIEKPWDLKTATERIAGGDFLYMRGGVYDTPILFDKNGFEGSPTTFMNYDGEKVELVGVGMRIPDDARYITLIGIDQHGCRFDCDGLFIGDRITDITVWDCSFNDNIHPFDTVPQGTAMGVRMIAYSLGDGQDYAKLRRNISLWHCEAIGNDVDGFYLAQAMHATYAFLEAAWTPDTEKYVEKRADIFEYKHSNGFGSGNSQYRSRQLPSLDVNYLFCLSHHNGQDGWDSRGANTRLFGCTTFHEANVGHPFGGMGFKLWETNYQVTNCICYDTNQTDKSGHAMCMPGSNFRAADSKDTIYLHSLHRKEYVISNCAMYHIWYDWIFFDQREGLYGIRLENNAVQDAGELMTYDITDYPANYVQRNVFWDVKNGLCADGALPAKWSDCVMAEPGFTDPDKGNFFPKENSPLLNNGDARSTQFYFNGRDLARLDGLGRPRASWREAGPYTRYSDDIIETL